MAVSMIGPKFYAWDRDGKPLAFGKVYTYEARTNNPKPTYRSEDQKVANTNPVILNGEGYADIYLEGSYKVVLKDKDDNEIWSADPVSEPGSGDGLTYVLTAYYLTSSSFKVLGDHLDVTATGSRVEIGFIDKPEVQSTVITSAFDGVYTTVEIEDSIITTDINMASFPVGVGAFSDLKDAAKQAIQAAGGVPLGAWAAGVTYNAYNEYLVFNGVPYKPAKNTTLPYTTQGSDPTVAPDAGIVVPFSQRVEKITPTLTNLVFNTVAEMQAGKEYISYTSDPIMWLTVQGEFGKTVQYYTAESGDVYLGNGVWAVELDKQTIFKASASPRPTAVIYGDSITNQNIESGSYSSRGYYSWCNAIMGNPFTLISNQGVSGETTSQMLDRLQTVLDFKAGFVFILGGTNDLGLTSLTGEQIFANLKEMYDANLSNGSIVIACTITPTLTINTQTKSIAYYTCNNLIRDYARNNDNIVLADFAAAYPDATTTLPEPVENGTIDGTHPSIYGAYRMGKIAAKALNHLVSGCSSALPKSNNDVNSLATNATLTGTTGSAGHVAINMGDIADSCRLVVGTAVQYTKCSKIPRDTGDWQRVEYYSSGGSQGFITLVQEVTTGWSVGDKVQFKAEVRLNNPTTVRNCQIFLNIRDAGGSIIAQRVGLIESYGYSIFDDDVNELTIETTPLVIPVGAEKVELQVRPVATSGVFDFGRFGLRKV